MTAEICPPAQTTESLKRVPIAISLFFKRSVMSIKPLSSSVVVIASLLVTALASPPSKAQEISFVCTVDTGNVPTTYAQTPEGSTPVFKWTSNFFRPPYTPMQRCQEVTKRMNSFHRQNQLDALTSGRVNNLPVICAGAGCDPRGSNVLLTLKPNQSGNQVLQEIDANRSGAAGPSRQLVGGGSSSQSKSALHQNGNGTVTLNLQDYLQGAVKSSPVSQPTSPGLSPKDPGPVRLKTPNRIW